MHNGFGAKFVQKPGGGWDLPPTYQASSPHARELPALDCWYLVTGRGIARIVESISSLIAFGLIVSVNALFTPTYIAETVLIAAFLGSFVFLLLYAVNIVRATTSVRWIFHELIYTGLGAYMTSVTTAISIYSAVRWRHTPWILATIFCVFTQLAFVLDFVTLFRFHMRHPFLRNSDALRTRIRRA